MKKVELLAPAGDLERLKWAFIYGADAVYIGGPAFGLRANASNFTFDEIKEGTLFAHKLNKHVHVTVNIVLHNEDADKVLEYLLELEKCNVDAIIVSDPAIMDLALNKTKLCVHVSTQQSTLNKEAVKYFEKKGIGRVVLARETSKEDIIDIIKNTNIEIETFIHGSMCASFSGRCVLSNFLTGRDANRGGCAQVCRWDFDLYDGDKLVKGDKPFTFCTKDLSQLKYIDEMIKMNISSFKIEGRMRSIYYLATVIGIYRKVIDEYYSGNYKYNKEYEKILVRCANRESISQFFDGNKDETCQYYSGRMELSNQDFLGVVKEYDEKNNMILLEQRNYFKKGDKVEFFGYDFNIITYTLDEIYDLDKNPIEIVNNPKKQVYIKVDKKILPYYLMRKAT